MNRSPVRVGSALVAVALALGLLPVRAAADPSPSLWFAGTQLILERAQQRVGEIAVTSGDPGLERFLGRLGASIAFAPGQRYVIVTAADRRTITLTLDDLHVNAAGVTTTAPFAPYLSGEDVYVSLSALARALYVTPIADGGATVLQPQFGALDVRSEGKTTFVTLHGATPLVYKRGSAGADHLALVFVGLASTLERSRVIGAPGLGAIDVLASGSVRNPTTVVSFETPPGGARVLMPSTSPNDLTLAFAPPGVTLRGIPVPEEGRAAALVAASAPQDASPLQQGSATAAPSVEGSEAVPSTTPSPASVTAISVAPGADDTTNVQIDVSGNADFEWHRLYDGRWYVDIRGATLNIPPRDETLDEGGITALRARQFLTSPVPVVRVSLSLASQRRVDVVPSPSGLTVVVGYLDDLAPVRIGAGRIGDGAATAYAMPTPDATPRKFSVPPPGLPPGTNPRLIVLDPGHGGSDIGAQHNGLTEKDVNLDIARRLRSVLVARGWIVRMTRETDTDVYAPNDSAHDELQARCDVANSAGARMFVSIHSNSFTSSSLNGTTTYYYKAVDLALAQAVHRRLIASLGTKDDGVRKDNFYVIHHTTMPAILIETAFLSNPDDAALLRSPEFLQRIALAIAGGVADYAAQPQSASNEDTTAGE